MRKQRTYAPPLLLSALIWGGFFVHACTAGPAYLDPARLDDIAAAPRVQVAITRCLRVEKASFAVRGPYSISGESGPVDRGDSLAATVRWDRGIRINDRPLADAVVRVTCAQDGDLEIGGVRYHGDLLIVADEDRQTRAPRITLVNEVNLESYLKGVVGKEMSLSAGLEALKAQVIAARTYAAFETRNRTLRTLRNEKFDLYDDERSQVYGGMERETDLADRLVNETCGLFATWNGRPFKTFYSSTCGGRTEPARLVLGSEAEDIPPLQGTVCTYCEGSKYYRWSEAFPKSELAKKLFPDRPRAKIRAVRVSRTLPGGHASQVAVTLEGSSREVLLSANDDFRRKIDPRRIRSTLWEKIDDAGDKVTLTGRGWGHGAGLCQVGAYRMAEAGKTAAEILEYYYPQARVQKLY